MELVEAYQKYVTHYWTSPPLYTLPLTTIAPFYSPVEPDGSSAHANIYAAAHLTEEYTGNYAIDSFEQDLSLSDDEVMRVSQRRPVWAEFTTDKGDYDGQGIPSAVDRQTWGR